MAARMILIIDDSEIVREMAGGTLVTAGYEVRSVGRWEEVDQALAGFNPDLILMDINMPEVFGDHALMFFKEERGLEQVPILLFSDIDEQELKLRARECGADGYVSKGWGVERLVEIVASALPKP